MVNWIEELGKRSMAIGDILEERENDAKVIM